MHKASAGKQRFIADVQRLLSTLLMRDVSDPRFAGVTITRIEASGRQLLTIWVYRGEETDQRGCVDALNRMAPHFGHELRRAMPKRRIPELRFSWDSAFEKSGDVLMMLRQLERP